MRTCAARPSVRRSWRWDSSTAAPTSSPAPCPSSTTPKQAGRVTDAAALRCELASAAVRCEDPELAEALLGPVADGAVLPPAVRIEALTAWAGARALRGDVEGADAAAEQAQELLVESGGLAVLHRIDLDRVRASARRRRGDAAGAVAVLRAAPEAGDPSGEDAGRRAALLVADQVDLLLDMQRPAEARAAAAEVLRWTPEVATALPLGRVRCALAGRAHLPAGELDAAEALARAAERDLVPRGHDAQAAEALQVCAAVAERRGDLARTVDALRRAHALELAARGAVADTRIALSTALAAPAPGDESPTMPSAPAAGGRADDAPRRTRSSRRAAEERATEAGAGTAEAPAGSPFGAPESSPTSVTAEPPTPEPPTAEPPTPPLGARHRGPDVETGGDREAGPTETHSATGAGSGDGAGAPAADGSAPMAGRRRGRYREDVEPGPLLAEALSAGSLDAFSTAPARPTDTAPDGSPEPPVATGPDPVEHPAAGMLAELLAGEEDADRFPAYPVLDGLDVSSDPLGLGPGILDGLDDRGGIAALGAPADDDRGEHDRTPTPDITSNGTTPDRPDLGADGDLGESAEDRRTRRARERWESAVSLLPRRGSEAAPLHVDPDDPLSSERPGTRGGTLAPGRDDSAARDLAVPPAAPGPDPGDDDEVARELALTLVGLLAEYGDPDQPSPDHRPGSGGGTATGMGMGMPAGPSPDRTGLVPARSGGVSPGPTPTMNGHGPSADASPASTSHDRGAPEGFGGGHPHRDSAAVPTARRADDSGAKLADLLAEAMDAFRRTGQDPAPGTGPPADDQRRVRR